MGAFARNRLRRLRPRMEEEIVVDDIDENSATDTQQVDDPTTSVMPLLYIQQNKVRSTQSSNINQTIVSPNTQLAAIINPVNNQIVTGQNKVFIQGPSQVATSQSKQHIVIHRPINTVSTAATSQAQKHILLRKSTSTAQILPLNTTQGNQTNAQVGKHTFAYLGTLIKPNKSRESVVIPAGTLTPAQITKPKLVITPVISQLAPTPTSTTSGSQSQAAKHMANLILPVNISQQSGTTKPSMFNLKINNGQLSTESKGTITVLRESKTTNSTTHPPPLHPIKMSLLSANKNNSNSIDSIKITENPDSAVITPIPKKEDNQPEKRKKTISNILRGSTEKRMKKQHIPKSPQDSLADSNYALSSPESEQDKDKKTQNDDDITLIKVIPSEDKVSKLNTNMDDDIRIEIIKTPINCNTEVTSDNKNEVKSNNCDETKEQLNQNNTLNQNNMHFDASKILDWKDGVGTLPGSNLQFRMNEFGIMEVVDEDESSKQNKDGIGDKENVCLTQNSSKTSSGIVNNTNIEKKADERKSRSVNADTVYHCEACGCYGLAAEFESPISCSPSCTEVIEAKKQPANRKDKDPKEVRIKKKRKKLLQESQLLQGSKEIDEKSDEKTQDKTKEMDEEKEVLASIDDELQADSSESKFPWQRGKSGFSWPKYLDHCKAKAAPVKLFKDPFPYSKNHFRVGMKLEGIDPEHPSRYCVLTIAEVVGYRMRVHFDGYPENYDFWINADSMNIFPAGWSEKNGKKLDPPKGYTSGNFNWNAYLKICKAPVAAKNLFPNKGALQTVFPTGFRVGMKLEAVDRKHSSLLCVASIAGLMDSRILVHFDSWDEVYDYWADASSPYIHPVGWSHHNGRALMPPNTYKDAKSFTWDAYLKETGSVAAPARAFKQRPPCAFRRGMKLEAVDKRVPQLIRVATVEDVKDHQLKIKFDGWPDNHAYWVDDDSPDIHPVGWCVKTGHPLEPPLIDQLTDRPECGTYGCRGIGHIKGPKFATHNSTSGCPYSSQNLNKSVQLLDRYNLAKNNDSHEADDYEMEIQEKSKLEKTDKKTEKSQKFDKPVPLDDGILMSEKEKQKDGDSSDKNDKSGNTSENDKSENTSENNKSENRSENDKSENRSENDKSENRSENDESENRSENDKSENRSENEKPENTSENEKSEDRSENDESENGSENDKSENKPENDKSENRSENDTSENKPENDKSENGSENDKSENRSENSDKSNKLKNLHSDNGQTDDDEISKKRKKRHQNSEEPSFSVSNITNGDVQTWNVANVANVVNTVNAAYAADIPVKQLRKELYQSVYNPGYNPLPNAPHIWAKHSNALNRVVSKQTTNPRRWSNEEVIKFVQSMPNCAEAGNIFRQNNIDGESFLMLTQEDLVSVLRLRLGPAIKLYNSIVLLRQKAS
ncbi:PREDICTED: lethal(3)malignant brain tumor-like protein 3 [Trachymyrmex septentrionalis]|uniref:lethal(3)malignant brain tumor-like protein 3 n=1 Tax=Trachymyrmex septentrionalis TaxID=34720 RepID=UPI00084F0801|nr:PREDICTED: lethal(3)malignant brain tumor-like protein 3 [Trachymyrmex septentrionalis]